MNTGELAESLVVWIRERVSAGGCKGVVLGMSGGVDSCVVAVLCQRACPQSTIGVLMPCHSIREDEKHALAEAKAHDFFPPVTIEPVLYDGRQSESE